MSDSTAHTLRMTSKPVQKAAFVFISLFLISPFIFIDSPIDGLSFPEPVVLAARIVTVFSIIAALVCAIIFLFYRTREKIYLDERGIRFPHYPFIPWKSIQWYKIHVISNQGINGMGLKTDSGKVWIQAEDDEALFHFKEEFKQKIEQYNPAAKDFRELKSSKLKAIMISGALTVIYLAACMLMDFEKKFVWIFLPVLLITIGAVWIEHIKIPGQQNQSE